MKTFRCPAPPTATSTIWSPDGAQIVFNRGMGIFDLFIVNLDGSNLRQITHGGVPGVAGGLAGGWQFPLHRAGPGVRVHRLPPRPRQRRKPVFSNENIQSLSPDGQYVAIASWPSVSAGRSISAAWTALTAGRWPTTAVGSEPPVERQWRVAAGHCLGHRLGFYHRRADQPAHLPGHLPAAPRRQPPRLEAVRFPFSPGVGAAVGVCAHRYFDSGGVCDMIPSCQSNPFLSPNSIAQLHALGVQPGGVLLVHCAFSKVKPVEGGPAGLIAALRLPWAPRARW